MGQKLNRLTLELTARLLDYIRSHKDQLTALPTMVARAEQATRDLKFTVTDANIAYVGKAIGVQWPRTISASPKATSVVRTLARAIHATRHEMGMQPLPDIALLLEELA